MEYKKISKEKDQRNLCPDAQEHWLHVRPWSKHFTHSNSFTFILLLVFYSCVPWGRENDVCLPTVPRTRDSLLPFTAGASMHVPFLPTAVALRVRSANSSTESTLSFELQPSYITLWPAPQYSLNINRTFPNAELCASLCYLGESRTKHRFMGEKCANCHIWPRAEDDSYSAFYCFRYMKSSW